MPATRISASTSSDPLPPCPRGSPGAPARSPRARRHRLCLAAALAAAALCGCGKKGAPQPPLPRTPPAISDFEVTLQGSVLEATWTARPPQEPGAVRVSHDVIWKREEGAGAEAGGGGPATRPAGGGTGGSGADRARAEAAQRALLADGRRTAGPSVDWAAAGSRAPRHLEARVDINAPGPGGRLAAMAAARAGRREIPSNVVTVTVPALPLEAPRGFAAEARPDGIALRWEPIDTETRLEIFRAGLEPEFGTTPLVRVPPASGEFLDRSARLGERYRYAARLRAAAGERAWVAGPAAELPSLLYIDSFPPAAPEGLTVLMETEGARLLWSPNREPDLAGYRVYRRVGGGTEERVAEVRGWEVTWVDAQAPEGETVEYRITAFDSSTQANESPFSRPASTLVRRLKPLSAPPAAAGPPQGAPSAPGAAPQSAPSPPQTGMSP